MDFDRQLASVAREGEVVLRAQQKLFVRFRERARRCVAERLKKRARATYIALADDDVQINETSKREVAVGADGERGAFICECGDALALEKFDDLYKLRREKNVSRRVLAKLINEFL